MTPGEAGEQLVQTCASCSTLLDVSDYEPLAQVTCPVCGTVARVERMFNQFTLLDVLGEGGMGTVFKALDTSLNRTVALKLLRKEFSSDAEYLAKLDMEAKITASINHPHVVKVYSFGQDHGQFYLAMELVDKGTLDDLLELQGRVAELQTLEVGIQAASGLLAAQERGLIHRDVKPGNILFADSHTAKISDFGLAILAEREAEVRGEIWGTPYYVAPEKLNNEPEDFRSDMYSLGATLFHALAGRPPFEASTASLVALKHLKSQAVSLQSFAPDVSEETAYCINRMLSKDPNLRYQSYEELIEHMKFALDARTAALHGGGAQKERVVIESQAQQTFIGWMTFALLLVVLGAGIFLYVNRERFFGASEPVEAESPGERAMQMAQTALLAGSTEDVQEPLKKAIRDVKDDKMRALLRLYYATAVLVDGGNYQMQFRVLEMADPYSTAPDQKKLADAIETIGIRLSNDDPIPKNEADKLPVNGPESVMLLLYGLKNFRLGEPENSAIFFERFLSGNQSADKWLADLRPLAEACLKDAKAIGDALKELKDSPNKKQEILDKMKLLQAKPNAPGDLGEITKARITQILSEHQAQIRIMPARKIAEAQWNSRDSIILAHYLQQAMFLNPCHLPNLRKVSCQPLC